MPYVDRNTSVDSDLYNIDDGCPFEKRMSQGFRDLLQSKITNLFDMIDSIPLEDKQIRVRARDIINILTIMLEGIYTEVE